METNYGVYHLADNPAQYQPVRTNNYRCICQGLEELVRVGGDANNRNDYLENAQEVIDFSVVSFDAPNFTQDEIQIRRGNSTVYFAGTPRFNTSNLVINDFVGADGKSILQAWQALSYDVVNDIINPSTKYKKDMLILEYTPDNVLIKVWELKGCWITSLTETGYRSESPAKKTVTATIRYDRAIPRKPDEYFN